MEFSPVILAHIYTALGAVVFGGATLALRKGTRLHRVLGRIWVGLMVSTALISFGIKTSGHFSAIHILSVVTLAGVSAAVFAAARGRIRAHRAGMTATYAGLVIAGAFTLLPGRLLGDLVWGALGIA
ncbi:MAG TPA: DUF2306 domain-containing protein [Noviherbaspirillum sp.]|nr:DUF2306 domain-containing protein [Noviherbaspirillum sp.]